MIRRLQLKNWRNYEDAGFDLSSGTTFVVASNGVGKTSFVEAARWALFGSPLPSSPARVGTDETSAMVELVLPDASVLTAKRVWDRRKTRPAHQLTLLRGAEALNAGEWEQLCIEQFGCTLAMLERLTMPSPTPVSPTALGLREHLGKLYGLDDLAHASRRLTTELTTVSQQIADLKKQNTAKSKELDELKDAIAASAEAQRAAQEALDDAKVLLRRAQVRDQQVELAASHQRDVLQAGEAERALVQQVAEILGQPVSIETADAALSDRLAKAESNLEAIRLERRLAEQRRKQIDRDLAGLDGATDECPTCRRPLDEGAREHAHALWRQELEELDSRFSEASAAEPEAEARVTLLRQTATRLSHLRQKVSELADLEEVAGSGEAPPTDDATEQYRVATEVLTLAREEQRSAERSLREAVEADQNLKLLESLFKTEGLLLLAKEATEATRFEVLSENVEPLAEALDLRWSSLFPDRGAVTTGADGAMSRTIGGHPLGFEAFSTAESTAAMVIMRILVAQMTTTATFAWFDEPLEHLDPDVRRNVASLLSKITEFGSLKQVVVTTYEEALARKLHERAPAVTSIVDLRQAETL